jgi:hypothetical protein
MAHRRAGEVLVVRRDGLPVDTCALVLRLVLAGAPMTGRQSEAWWRTAREAAAQTVAARAGFWCDCWQGEREPGEHLICLHCGDNAEDCQCEGPPDEFTGAGCCPEEDGYLRGKAMEREASSRGPSGA